jgi:penicillin-binding protein 1C
MRIAGRAGRIALWRAPLAAAGVVLALLAYLAFAPLEAIERRAPPAGVVVLDRHGAVIHRESGAGLRIPVTLEEVAPVMVAATIAAEDQRFYGHPGVDPVAIAREARALPAVRSGASTITQQLARRLYLDDGQPLLVRKAREALLAAQLEVHYSKDEILAAYLNQVFYGRGAYGVEAAARAYFGVAARDLDLAQASMLAGLPQRPGLDPGVHVAEARARQAYVLGRLEAEGTIGAAERAEAAAAPLALLPDAQEAVAPHFVEHVFADLARVAPELAGRDDLVIETTLEGALQREAQRMASASLARIAERGATGAAVVVLDPADGRILAMVGSPDFEGGEAGQINMAVEPRQPGSALKPFLYAAAFERGYTPATMVLDIPSRFDTPRGTYQPVNFDLRYRGPVPVRVALASSLNVPAVRTLDEIGEDAFLELLHRVGLRGLDATEAYGLSLTLGAGEVPLLDLAAAYGAIAAEGLLARPYAIERVRDTGGAVLYERRPRAPLAVLEPGLAFLLADILSDPVARIPGFGSGSVLETPLRAAVKTGTSSGFRDTWTVGFTPDRVVGVWVGNPDGAPMREISSADSAGPIWRAVLEVASEGLPRRAFARPEGVVGAQTCAPTGLLPGPDCPSVVSEWFVEGTQPVTVEAYYGRDADGRLRFDPPDAARAWAREAGLPLTEERSPGLAAGAPAPEVHIVSPGPGAVLYLAPELDTQAMLLRASVPAGAEAVEFAIDGEAVGATSGADPLVRWTLAEGAHELKVVARLSDGRTVSASTRFEVHAQ